jgi:hypothetical protein
MSTPLTRANFADLLDPAFRKVYSDADKELDYKYDQVFNVSTSSKNLEKDTGISGLGTLTEKTEGGTMAEDTVYQGYDSTYTHKTYALKTSITKEMIADDQYREVNKRAQGLATATNRSVEQAGADVLNYGWTSGGGGKAAFVTGGDAVALFSDSHPRSDGGTVQGNQTTADLAEDSLEAILIDMRTTLDDRGQLMLIRPDKMIVPPALEKEAYILLNTDGRVGTANNDVNPYKGRLNVVVWDFIGAAGGGSDTAFFIVDSKMNPLNWFWRQRPELDRNVDFDTKNIEYSVDARWSCGFSTWRGLYGSKGDNS